MNRDTEFFRLWDALQKGCNVDHSYVNGTGNLDETSNNTLWTGIFSYKRKNSDCAVSISLFGTEYGKPKVDFIGNNPSVEFHSGGKHYFDQLLQDIYRFPVCQHKEEINEAGSIFSEYCKVLDDSVIIQGYMFEETRQASDYVKKSPDDWVILRPEQYLTFVFITDRLAIRISIKCSVAAAPANMFNAQYLFSMKHMEM